MANNMTAELVTWRADGEETGFDYDPTLDDLTDEQPGTVAMLYDETAEWRYDGADWTAVGGAEGGEE